MQVIEALAYTKDSYGTHITTNKNGVTCRLWLAKIYKIVNKSSLAIWWEDSNRRYGGLYVGEKWNHSWKPLGFERNTCIYK